MSDWAIVIAAAAAAVAVVSYVGTGAVLRYSRARGLIDEPGERRSHDSPTPRGGGLAIVVAVLGAIGVLGWFGAINVPLAKSLFVGGGLVSLVGWIDDHRSLRPSSRLFVHFVAAGIAVYYLTGFPTFHAGDIVIKLGWIGWPAAMLAIVCCLNAYNFMDGIDGIAGAEGLSVGVVGAIALLLGGRPDLALVPALAAAACAGFLPWNWSPARIFMGDVGSCFVGYVFGVLAVATERSGSMPALVWLALLAVFAVDTFLTFVRRMLRGERVLEAHREHAYQRLLRVPGWTHARVTLAVTGVNLILDAIVIAAVWGHTPVLAALSGVIVAVLAYLLTEMALRPTVVRA